MVNLISSSTSRAKILDNFGIDFKQIPFRYDETLVLKKDPFTYSYCVTKLKEEQFLSTYDNMTNLLFADSSVIVKGKIYGKAKDEDSAYTMLKAQSGNISSIVSSFIYITSKFRVENTSITTYKFSDFDESDLKDYIKSGECFNKAGAMMIEGFNKKYIISQKGNTSTAMGLNAEILKAYLCL
ncbi:MAG: septum formation inhibitor Maf [Campylobacter sp.]|nr:septum formation inhibitor Maf [Campylobacter sp.]